MVRVHRGAPGRMRWPQAGPVPVSCSLALAPASRVRTPPMAGSWLAGSGSGGEPGSGSGCGGRLSASPRSRLGQVGDDAAGAALGAARAGRESRSGTPGSRAMHSSNRAPARPRYAPGCCCASPATRARGSATRGRPGQHRAQRQRHRHRPDRAGYVAKQKDGRRNRYQIQAHLRCPNPPARNPPSAASWPCSRAPARDCS